jgi:hypothetical protein
MGYLSGGLNDNEKNMEKNRSGISFAVCWDSRVVVGGGCGVKNPKVLVACEESQVVTIEFRKMGIEAYSCDVQESSGGHPEWHIKQDVLEILNDGWDCMIAFPPCTYLSSVGNRWFNEDRYGQKARDRKIKRADAFRFFMTLWWAKIPYIAIENPVGCINSHFRKPDQIIHPWYFGDTEMKKTCLWLKNLSSLKYDLSDKKKPKPYWRHPKHAKKAGQAVYFTESHGYANPKDRAKLRSKTFPGIAKAMATQWGKFLLEIEENA